jgi:hypothetical protein
VSFESGDVEEKFGREIGVAARAGKRA